jgi:hypothetical protein
VVQGKRLPEFSGAFLFLSIILVNVILGEAKDLRR